MAMGKRMNINKFANKVETKEDFKNNKLEWENYSLEHYLEGLYGFTSDIDGYYQNMKQDVDTTQVSWKMMARILLAARVYE